MGAVTCQVASGNIGTWTAAGAFPANMNDGDDATFNYIVGSSAGFFTMLYDSTVIPTGSAITGVYVSGNCSNNTGGAAQTWSCYLGAANTVIGTFNTDLSNYYFQVARPGGGTWTKAELGTMYLYVACDGAGGGNPMRVRSSVLSVYYGLAAVPGGLVFDFG